MQFPQEFVQILLKHRIAFLASYLHIRIMRMTVMIEDDVYAVPRSGPPLVDSFEEETTCGLTELAFIRLSSNPAFTRNAVTPYEAATFLERLVALEQHEHRSGLPHLRRPSET